MEIVEPFTKEELHTLILKCDKKARSNKTAIIRIFEHVPKFLIDLISLYIKEATNKLSIKFIVDNLKINQTYLINTINFPFYRKKNMINSKIVVLSNDRQYLKLNYTPILKELYYKYKDNIL